VFKPRVKAAAQAGRSQAFETAMAFVRRQKMAASTFVYYDPVFKRLDSERLPVEHSISPSSMSVKPISIIMRTIQCLFILILSVGATTAQPNFIAELAKDPDSVRKLGLNKLTQSEQDEWNRLLSAVYAASKGESSTPQSSTASNQLSSRVEAPGASGQIWLSRADLSSEDVIRLENGAVFQVSIGVVGVGIRREVGLIREATRWSLWVSGKRVYRGDLLRPPDIGKPLSFTKTSITSVASDGSLLTMLDGTVYEVDLVNRVDTTIWLPVSDVLILENGRIINLNDSSRTAVNCRRLSASGGGTTPEASQGEASASFPEASPLIETRVDGEFQGWSGETIVKLTNGQIWQQTEFHYRYTSTTLKSSSLSLRRVIRCKSKASTKRSE
jgi:hypothetical protein